MKRREFVTLLGGTALAWPLAVRAQQPERMRRIEVLVSSAVEDSYGQARVSGFRESLAKEGWTEGHNVKIDTRWGITDRSRAQELAKEIVALGPDLILTQGSPITQALKQATTAIPVVFLGVSDPLGSGLLPASPTQVVTSPGSQILSSRSAENGWPR
jgi:putative ABC transport system substrate-binding protein